MFGLRRDEAAALGAVGHVSGCARRPLLTGSDHSISAAARMRHAVVRDGISSTNTHRASMKSADRSAPHSHSTK